MFVVGLLSVVVLYVDWNIVHFVMSSGVRRSSRFVCVYFDNKLANPIGLSFSFGHLYSGSCL